MEPGLSLYIQHGNTTPPGTLFADAKCGKDTRKDIVWGNLTDYTAQGIEPDTQFERQRLGPITASQYRRTNQGGHGLVNRRQMAGVESQR